MSEFVIKMGIKDKTEEVMKRIKDIKKEVYIYSKMKEWI